MATFYQSDFILKRTPASIESGPCTVTTRTVFAVKAALAVNDIIEALVLPADHVLQGAVLDADDLDVNATPLLTLDVGIMSGGVGLIDLNRTVGTHCFSGDTVGQAGGVSTSALRTVRAQMPVSYDRSIGIKVKAAPGTNLTLTASNAKQFRGFWQSVTAYAQYDYLVLPNGLRAYVSTAGTSGAVMPMEAFSSAVFGGTVTDGTVTWTICDPYLALTVSYRSTQNGL